ncbi:MAG: urease accessory protein UreF [Actinobacteria bacterium]|uniref:Unannotated protein n=1 Tax=freshwater metagenome TaxID=449393 RepID=A0A6J6NBP9_9ZZZZ|nr:urease accessory protein UreF [Actinomycetota bacterium]
MSAPSAGLVAHLLADARLPVAGHTQSATLEPALVAGLPADRIPDYVRLRLRTVTRVEAATAVVALSHQRSGRDLRPVVEAWQARTPSAAMRATARTQGKALLRLVARLWPESAAVHAVAALSAPPRPIVLAAAADAGGLSPVALAGLVGYDDVQTVISAALKLTPMDPVVAAQWVHHALPEVDTLAVAVATLTRPGGIPASGAPQIEAWAEAHAVTPRRLFSA